MSRFVKYLLIVLGVNVAFFGLVIVFVFFSGQQSERLGVVIIGFGLWLITLLIQLIAGMVMAARSRNKELGQAMLLSVGLIMLIGFSVCSQL